MKIIILILLLINYNRAAKLSDYCKESKANTPCKYKCERSSSCGNTGYSYTSLTSEEKEAILKKHNELRNEVAGGKYASQHLPAGGDIMAMSWDKETEFLAGCYIKQCIWGHDKKRIALDGTNMGQNLYTRSSSGDFNLTLELMTGGVQAWFDEISLLTASNSAPFFVSFKSVKGAGHLTQVVWGASEKLGCAKMFNMRKGYTWDMFCNYRPAGNFIGRKLYTTGAGSCTKNSKYSNLCGTIREMADDTYEPPISLDDSIKLQPQTLIIFMSIIVLGFCTYFKL